MKILTLDIETSPNLAHVWGLFDQTVSLAQLRESTKVIAVAAKWHDSRGVLFASDFHDGHGQMLEFTHALLDSADVLITYNGKRFDVPHLYREYLLAGMTPPSPVQHVDLLQVVKGRFRFVSNKLDHVVSQLDIGSKTKHAGHELWVQCMAGNGKAWEQMRKYNCQDVRLTERLYNRVRPWISGHPHMGLHAGQERVCQNCGSGSLTRQGFAFTSVSKFQRYRCNGCGAWSRGKSAVARVDTRSVAA